MAKSRDRRTAGEQVLPSYRNADYYYGIFMQAYLLTWVFDVEIVKISLRKTCWTEHTIGASVVKHVAAVNYMLGAAILQERPPAETGGESGPESITTKGDIVKYLKASFEYAHKALGTINEKNSWCQPHLSARCHEQVRPLLAVRAKIAESVYLRRPPGIPELSIGSVVDCGNEPG